MNSYEVTINNHKPVNVNAGRAAVAVHRAMDHFLESEYKPVAHIKVRYIGKVKYTFDVLADVPLDYGVNGTKRETVSTGHTTEAAAEAAAKQLAEEHPLWRYVRTVRRVAK